MRDATGAGANDRIIEFVRFFKGGSGVFEGIFEELMLV